MPSAERSLRCATASSIIFAMKIVQVTSEAKARPIITALTRTSADRNIDHGDNSRSAGAIDFSDLARSSAEVAAGPAGLDATAWGGVAGAGACPVGAACVGLAAGCDSAGTCCGGEGACWADACCADITANAKATAGAALKNVDFMSRSSSGSHCSVGRRPGKALPRAEGFTTIRRNGRQRAHAGHRYQPIGGARGWNAPRTGFGSTDAAIAARYRHATA